jgi:D-serine deaminase-like pyridoxal phosphate-dependent protein
MQDLRAWYLVNNIDQFDSPALVVYTERVKHNIATAIKMAGDVSRLRPHVKTHKSVEVTKMMMQAGIRKFKCATIAEAQMLGDCGSDDVLLAYQPTGPKTRRFLSLIENYPQTQFSCLADSQDAMQAISMEAVAKGISVNILIDINVGMNRTGASPRKAVELYMETKTLPGIIIIGIHGYDGHINDTDPAIRSKRAGEVFEMMTETKKALEQTGLRDPVMVAGGSPTFPMHAKRNAVECSPGTFVYWDKSYGDLFPDMNFLPAALVITRVVSVINDTTVCLDLGHKSIASENSLSRRVHFLNAENLEPVGHSEEHLVMDSPAPHGFRVGDVLYGMPYHVCPTCALYESALVVENNQVVGSWRNIARDRKLTI